MLVFDDGDFSESETVLLSDSMAHLPHEVLSKNFTVNETALRNCPNRNCSFSRPTFRGNLRTIKIRSRRAWKIAP